MMLASPLVVGGVDAMAFSIEARPPVLGEEILVFRDERTQQTVHVPTDWYDPEKLALIKQMLSVPLAQRFRYFGVTFNLLDVPRDTFDKGLVYAQSSVPRPDPKKPKDWTRTVRAEMKASGGKMIVIVKPLQAISDEALGTSRLTLEIEGISSYAGNNFSDVVQRELDTTPVGGVIWWKSAQLDDRPGHELKMTWIVPKTTSFNLDQYLLLETEDELRISRRWKPLKVWLQSIDGTRVSSFDAYPDVVRIEKTKATVTVPPLKVVWMSDLSRISPPFRLLKSGSRR